MDFKWSFAIWYCAVCRYENKEVIKLDKIHIIMSGTPCKKLEKKNESKNKIEKNFNALIIQNMTLWYCNLKKTPHLNLKLIELLDLLHIRINFMLF